MKYKIVFDSDRVIYADSVSLHCFYNKDHSLLPSASIVNYPLKDVSLISIFKIDSEPSLFKDSDYE